MLEFTVVAGPNGAGKSSFSRALSKINAIIFDPDEEKRKILADFPDLSEEAAEAELTRVYERFETEAINSNRDFTVETNFRNDYLSLRAKYFKSKGYKINLICFIFKGHKNVFRACSNACSAKRPFCGR